jgi:hypothetical protein
MSQTLTCPQKRLFPKKRISFGIILSLRKFSSGGVRKIDTGPAVAKLHADLGLILAAKPEITFVNEPQCCPINFSIYDASEDVAHTSHHFDWYLQSPETLQSWSPLLEYNSQLCGSKRTFAFLIQLDCK